MNTQSLNLPEDLGYTARHVWARTDGDTLVIGITDFAQDQLGEILFVDLPDAGASFGYVRHRQKRSVILLPRRRSR